MQRCWTFATLLLTLLLACAGGVGFALAGDGAAGDLRLLPSAAAGLLPPITIEGRSGWACTAERNATASSLPDAALPAVP